MTKDDIRKVFLANGYTIKEGQTDLKPYVYEAAAELLELAAKECDGVAKNHGNVVEGSIATDFGKAIHEAMAAGAVSCAATIRVGVFRSRGMD